MTWDRRAFLGATAASVAGLSLLPARADAQTGQETTYGVIEIRRGGMSVSVYRFDLSSLARTRKLSGFERVAPKYSDVNFAERELASPLGPAADDATAAQSVDLVAGHIDRLKSQYGLKTGDMSVLVGGGAVDFSPSRVERFIRELPPRTGITPEIVTLREQARLGYDWLVRPTLRDSVMHFDVGTGYIKAGYYDRTGRASRFVDLSAPYGVKTMTIGVKQRWPDSRTANFGQRSSEFYADTVAPVLDKQIAAEPSTMKRPQVYLTGEIVWATALILHTKAVARRQAWVDFAADDFAKLLGLIAGGTTYGGPLPADLTDQESERVRAALRRLRNAMNPHEIAAGAAVMDGLSRQFRFDQRTKVVMPRPAGTNIWVSQYLVEKFG